MISVDLSTSECDGKVVVALHGELDMADAASVPAALATVAASQPEIIVDLSRLKFIDSNGAAALARGRETARHAGDDLHSASCATTPGPATAACPNLAQAFIDGSETLSGPAGARLQQPH
jgi:anti-anti-sigma factor